MKNNLYYCKVWSIAHKKPIDLLSRDEAALLHEKGERYTVLVDSETKPSIYIEMIKNDGYILVGFLDEYLREHVIFVFKILKDKKLFLTRVVVREFKHDTDRTAHETIYIFWEDGHVVIEKKDYVKDKTGIVHSKCEPFYASVLRNYDIFPRFGDYASIMRKGR